MFADSRVVLLDFHFLRMEPTVLRRGVVMSGSRCGHKSNFFSHLFKSQLYFLAAFAQVFDDLLDAKLVDNTQSLT